MELQTALDQISEIHRQMARTRIFRGYRALTTLVTGLIAGSAAAWQAWSIPDPAAHPEHLKLLEEAGLVVTGVSSIISMSRPAIEMGISGRLPVKATGSSTTCRSSQAASTGIGILISADAAR